MTRMVWRGLMTALLLSLFPVSVAAAPVWQDGGGIHFGPYTLQPSGTVSGDLVVMGGPVDLGADAILDGDLTVFGPVTVGPGAVIEGQLVVMGAADVSGRVNGDVFAAGMLTLREDAFVEGDVAAAGAVDRAPGAVIEGELSRVDEDGLRLPGGLELPGPFSWPRGMERNVEIRRTPRWVNLFWRIVRGIAGVVVLTLLALVVTSLWPSHVDRISRVIEEAPLPAFGVGLLGLILSGLAAALLAITICLSPFALVGLIVVGVAGLLGWVSLGAVVGRRLLGGTSNRSFQSAATLAAMGTALVTLILALSRVFGALNAFLLFVLVPPGVGAVVLTRFGTTPYATRGTTGRGPTSPRPPDGPSQLPSAPEPPAPPSVQASPEEQDTRRHEPILPQGEVSQDEAGEELANEEASTLQERVAVEETELAVRRDPVLASVTSAQRW